MPNEPNPVRYREMHEHAAGIGLDEPFFSISKIDPNAVVKCNCAFDEGHQPHCDIVYANKVMADRLRAQAQRGAAE